MAQKMSNLSDRGNLLRTSIQVVPAKEFPHKGTLRIMHPMDIERIWFMLGNKKPTMDFEGKHQYNAFILDRMHDWDVVKTDTGPIISLYCVSTPEPYWIVIEYKRLDLI